MPILNFKVSNEVAETVNTLAKKTGISRNELRSESYIINVIQISQKYVIKVHLVMTLFNLFYSHHYTF